MTDISDDFKIGDEVWIPELDGRNSEWNTWTIAGVNEIGWLWLTLKTARNEKDGENVIEDYGGYNSDMIMERGQFDWEPRLIDERSSLNWRGLNWSGIAPINVKICKVAIDKRFEA